MRVAKENYDVGILGCGTLGRLIAEGVKSGLAGGYRVKGTFDEFSPDKAKLLAEDMGASFCTTLDQLLLLQCDYIIEAANIKALKAVAAKCLAGGSNLVALSTGAFADERFFEDLSRVARTQLKNVHIPSGALGGFDLARAAAAAGELSVTMTTEKPPRALSGAPALTGRELSATRRELVFHGTGREAVTGFPQNVNVVASLGLATVGLDNIVMEIYSDPALCKNKHTVMLDGVFGRAKIEIEATPATDNPKSSALAAYSVMVLLKKLSSPIQID